MRVLLGIVLMVATAVAGDTTTPQDRARSFLAATYGLTTAEIGRLDAGHVVSRTLETTHKRDVATLGVVRIPATAAKYVEHLTDIATFKRTGDVLQVGKFSMPPQESDVARLTLDEGDVRRLNTCRIDDCDLRLSADAIQQVARVDWRAATAGNRAADVVRQVLVDYVTRYRENGALMEYANRTPRLDVRAEFASLVDQDRTTWRHLGDLRQHVLEYPAAGRGAVDFIYWSKERVHKRGVVSLTHMSIMRQPDEAPVRFAISSKQIYAMHYFDASLGLTLLVPDHSSASPAIFVVYLNRSRIDIFDGLLGGVVRRVVSGRARSLVADQLGRLQRTLGS